jgi:hypothetical protein
MKTPVPARDYTGRGQVSRPLDLRGSSPREEGGVVPDVSVSEVHRYPLRPPGFEKPLLPAPDSKRVVAEHLFEAPRLRRAAKAGDRTGEVAHAGFFCALLNSQLGGFYSPKVPLNEAGRIGVSGHLPDLHLSGKDFTVEEGGRALWVGLSYCKGISEAAGKGLSPLRAGEETLLLGCRPVPGNPCPQGFPGEPDQGRVLGLIAFRTRGSAEVDGRGEKTTEEAKKRPSVRAPGAPPGLLVGVKGVGQSCPPAPDKGAEGAHGVEDARAKRPPPPPRALPLGAEGSRGRSERGDHGPPARDRGSRCGPDRVPPEPRNQERQTRLVFALGGRAGLLAGHQLARRLRRVRRTAAPPRHLPARGPGRVPWATR